MSVAVCRSSFSPFESILAPNLAREPLPISPTNWQPPAEQYKPTEPPVEAEKDDDRPGQFDIWSSIQSQKARETATADPMVPYVHPLVRRSSSLMSQKSLEICTESLGSETGSADFSSLLDDPDCFSSKIEAEEEEHNELAPPIHETRPLVDEEERPRFRVAKAVEERRVQSGRKELVSVNYHCSISRRSPPRSFPPPLPSISRRDGPCIHMRPHRCNGRLVVEAVPVPSQNYLHAQRQDGRLLLSFIDATYNDPDDIEIDTPEATQEEEDVVESKAKEEEEAEEEEEAIAMAQEEEGELEEEKNCDEEEEDEEEVEEEVEVVDRGTVVEVKVSTQPQQQSGAMKMQRSSSFVINKFVGAGETRWAEKMAECKPTAPDKQQIQQEHHNPGTATPTPARRATPTTTTAAAAAAAASTFSTSSEGYYCSSYSSFHWRDPQVGGGQYASPDDHKLLFTSKRRNREELLHHMRRCSQLRRPLFILEPCCIATSS
ncbi:uncharacterized protein [Elaeis guineensis]|nr:protein FAF-like, chloroplastic isoform X2 [Elaeis guineensis]